MADRFTMNRFGASSPHTKDSARSHSSPAQIADGAAGLRTVEGGGVLNVLSDEKRAYVENVDFDFQQSESNQRVFS